MKYLILLFSAIVLFSCSQHQNVFYVDRENGEDTNDGLNPDNAWASLEKVNKHQFKPGDRILFKTGTVYQGQLKPSGSGTEGNPIIIDQYGEGEKPKLEGEGKYQATLVLENVEYWEVNNLEVTNTGEAREAGRRGVLIYANNFGEANHIYLRNLAIHDVNGSKVKSEGGGSAGG